MKQENIWKSYSEQQCRELEELSGRYKAFLDKGKTERECVKEAVRLAREAGYEDLKEITAAGKTLKAGDKVYAVCMEKILALYRKPAHEGRNADSGGSHRFPQTGRKAESSV